MILIFSESSDSSTSHVIDWLRYLEYPYLRINSQDHVLDLTLSLEGAADESDPGGVRLQISLANQKPFALEGVSAYWYRRGKLGKQIRMPEPDKLPPDIKYHLQDEWEVLEYALYALFEQKHSLGSYTKERYNNKIRDLIHALSVGLDIPYTLISNKKQALHAGLTHSQRAITKAIRENIGFTDAEQGFHYHSMTAEISQDEIDKLQATTFPTLIQQRLEKEYELRVFYLAGTCYAMAIFSQLDPQTREDFRNYNEEKPVRCVPYALPEEIERKLHQFMHLSGLDTGSIDLVKTPAGQYVFLEVNPVGQFHFVSVDCNYYLEKKIAEYLSQPISSQRHIQDD